MGSADVDIVVRGPGGKPRLGRKTERKTEREGHRVQDLKVASILQSESSNLEPSSRSRNGNGNQDVRILRAKLLHFNGLALS
jgi:hypothetical protein